MSQVQHFKSNAALHRLLRILLSAMPSLYRPLAQQAFDAWWEDIRRVIRHHKPELIHAIEEV